MLIHFFTFCVNGGQVDHWFKIQWKPLNVITLGQRETDNINRMITISELTTYKRVIWGRKNSFKLTTLTK